MAEAIVSVLVEQLGAFLYHEIEKEVIMVVEVKEEIQELTKTLTSIRAVLHDAEKKQVQNERVKVWLEDLMEAVYEIEDVLDDWNIKILKSGIKKGSLSSSKKVCSHLLYPCFCVKNSILLRHSVGRKVKEIRRSLKSIASRMEDFHLASGFEAETSLPRERTSSLVEVSDVYGREDDQDTIVKKILCESGHHAVGVPVISIVGLGGLGKTTLAKLINQDASIVRRFGKPIWACVSEPFDRIRLAKAIIIEAGVKIPDNYEWNTLHHLLEETLKNKLFLLILDDVWTENTNDRDLLKVCLDGGAAGSVILVTTRKVRVAEMMSSVYTHQLQGLTDENSWSLLQYTASIGDETEDYETFENIGKAIALKCNGVPLLIKTLGSLLRFKKTKHEWERVLKSEMWSLPEFVDTVYLALSLSFYDLPSSWKPCFMYCATFPKNHIIKKDVVIKLWMAHGFLHSSEGRELEEIGEDYFNGIISRSLFQDLDKDGSDDIRSCKMHDLVHDFVHFLSNKKTYIIEGDDVTFNNTKLHHLTVCGDKLVDITTVSSFDTMKCVRTLNLKGWDRNSAIGVLNFKLSFWTFDLCKVGGLKKILCHWTNLRSLDISHTGLELVPPEIEKLIHLRYLDLSSNLLLKKLPNTLGNLCNLQTLKLNGCCYNLRELPASMGKLINLRHLELDDTYCLRSLPKGIEKLPSLRSLSKFIVEKGRKLSDMKRFNLIQGRIEISGLCQVTDGDEFKEAELGSKQSIRDLILNFEKYEKVSEGCERWIRNLTLNFAKDENVSDGDEERMEGVLEALQPSPHLEKLSILDYPGSQLPCWMNDTSLFSKLRVLELRSVYKCTQLPSLGQLPLLEKLTIKNMRSLQRLDLFGICENKEHASNPIIAFPKLSELTLWEMRELEDWVLPFERSDIIQIMPSLRRLYIYRICDKLKALPAVWKLESLEELKLSALKSVRRIGPELFGIAENDVMGMNRDGESLIIFPKLKILDISHMFELEEWEMKMPNWREDITFLMPCLEKLTLLGFQKLKVIPQNIFSYQLVKGVIRNCPELKLPSQGTNQIIKRIEVGESDDQV